MTVLLVGLRAGAARADSGKPLTFGVGVEATTLTDFGAYFSLPFGLRFGADYRVLAIVPTLDLVVGAEIGWWMESFRDTFNFRPELVPVMIPLSAGAGLRFHVAPPLALEAGVQLGGVVEACPGAAPALLGLASPALALRWFFSDHVGAALRLGWTWAGADPVWGGPSVRLGLIFR